MLETSTRDSQTSHRRVQESCVYGTTRSVSTNPGGIRSKLRHLYNGVPSPGDHAHDHRGHAGHDLPLQAHLRLTLRRLHIQSESLPDY